ncbi:MAG: SBBP repeat-containing protein [Acidobacteriota bacterium]|nr:SBBP repeat-containing protein [Blastocatellia bacterium]MDW8241111.1 SBBP repeat-containing protein [Acidobacteriota bacterium]
MKRTFSLMLIGVWWLGWTSPLHHDINGAASLNSALSARAATLTSWVNTRFAQQPLSFESNQGQCDPRVKFLARGPGYDVYFAATEAVLHLRATNARESKQDRSTARADAGEPETNLQESQSATLRLKLIGARTTPQIVGLEPIAARKHYFIGNDPQQWRTDIPMYAKIKYAQVYPGVDLIYYGNQNQLEYDFVVAPGIDPNVIRIGIEGGDHLNIDAQGDLVIHIGRQQLRQRRPFIYQDINGQRVHVAGSFKFLSQSSTGSQLMEAPRSIIGFQVERYDTSHPLIIDPVLSYSTYLGGDNNDRSYAIAVDATGSVYVTGETISSDFPTRNAYETSGPFDAIVAKFSPSGALVYSTYLGGSDSETGYGIAVDAMGHAYVTGLTGSSNFPTTAGAFQRTFGGGQYDAFVTKLSPTGSSLIYSTYIGTAERDFGYGIALDATNSAYIVGRSYRPANVSYDVLVAKLNPTGSTLNYGVTFGGNPLDDEGYAIAVDSAGNAYVTGCTKSPDFPATPGVFQPTHTDTGCGVVGCFECEAFVTKVNAGGTALVYSTFLGGDRPDVGRGIVVDSAGNAYVTGWTLSTDRSPPLKPFPVTSGAFQRTHGGFRDGFIAKLNASGTALVYSTFLGGNSDDLAYAIALDQAGNVYVTGQTTSANFPVLDALPGQSTFLGSSTYPNAFVTKLNPSGAGLVYSTYLGGSENILLGVDSGDAGYGIAVDSTGAAYVTGITTSNNFPTASAFQRERAGAIDVFVAKLAAQAAPPPQVPVIMLTSGVPHTGSIPAPQPGSGILNSTQYTIQVPSGATRLRVDLSGNQDVDLFVRFGQPIQIQGGQAVADYRSTSAGGTETITITTTSSPPLRAGTYYIAVANFGPGAATFTLTATVTP